ncbi:MAG: hypothetical protein R2788_22975 [Saprospiraceae bacterium]
MTGHQKASYLQLPRETEWPSQIAVESVTTVLEIIPVVRRVTEKFSEEWMEMAISCWP